MFFRIIASQKKGARQNWYNRALCGAGFYTAESGEKMGLRIMIPLEMIFSRWRKWGVRVGGFMRGLWHWDVGITVPGFPVRTGKFSGKSWEKNPVKWFSLKTGKRFAASMISKKKLLAAVF